MRTFNLIILFLLSTFSFSQDRVQAEAMTDAIFALLELTAFVDANVSFCAELAPATAATVKQAADTWFTASGLSIITQAKTAFPEMASQFDALEATLKDTLLENLKSRAVGREAEWCQNVPTLLRSPEWDIAQSFATELDQLRQFVGLATGVQPLPQAQALQAVANPTFAQIVAAGINPETQIIPTEFRCYDEALNDTRRPHLILQFPSAGQYLSSYGGGSYSLEDRESYPDIEWLSGPLAEARSSLSFDEYGQSFYLSGVELGDESYDYQCFQQGASEERAKIDFRLKTPQAGAYTCRVPQTGEIQRLELANGSYTIGEQTGTYTVSEVVENGGSSRIDWLTGPFAEERSFYSEEMDTGFRDFSLSITESAAYVTGFAYSSSELALICEGVGEPVSYPKYGDELAPQAPATAQAVNGFYYTYEGQYTGTTYGYQPEFYRFFPDGYVFVGIPEAGDPSQIDCTRTLPNGAPFCGTYNVQANTIYITYGGEKAALSFMMNGASLVIDGVEFIPVTPNSLTSLNGLYWANYFNQVGFCGPYSFCSSTYLEWTFDFKPNGTFLYYDESQNLASMDTAIGSTNTSGFGNTSNAGSYSLGPYSIDLRFQNGRTEKHFFFVEDKDTFIIGDRRFTLKEESQ